MAETGEGTGQVDILLGSDYHLEAFSGQVIRGISSPVALESRFGWVLSGGLDTPELSENVNSNLLHTVHSLRISTENKLEHSVAKFWDLETMGVLQKEKSTEDEFVEQIK